MKRIVGTVLPEERDEILFLFERKNGLAELAKILTSENIELYNRLITDIGHNQVEFQGWWDRMAQKYNWESSPNGAWSIDFSTCEISLNDE